MGPTSHLRDYTGPAGRPVEAGVDISRPRHIERGEPLETGPGRHDLLGNDLRRFAQLARQLERNGRRQFAKFQIRRNLQRNFLKLDLVPRLQHRAKVRFQPLLHFQIHVEMPQNP